MNDINIFCNFIQVQTDQYECSKCGNIVIIQDDLDEPPLFPCSSLFLNADPNKIREFMGRKNSDNLSSIELINNRYDICSSCEFFKNNSCSKCGCNLTKDRNYLNKIAHEKEHCPLNKW